MATGTLPPAWQRDPDDLRFGGAAGFGAGAEQFTCGPSVLGVGHGQLEMVTAYLCPQLRWAASGDHPAAVQHGDLIGKPVGFFHVLRRQQDRGTGCDLVADEIP